MSDASELPIGREAVSGFAAKIAQNVAGFIGAIIFARILGPADFGGVVFLLAIDGVVGKPMSGWAIAGKKRLSERFDRADEAVGAQLLFNVSYVALITILLFVFREYITEIAGLDNAIVLLAFLLLIEATLVTLRPYIEARGRIGTAYWLDATLWFLVFPFRLVFVLLLGAPGMIYGSIAAAMVLLPAGIYFTGARPSFPSVQLLRSYYDYARYSIPEQTLGTITKRVDVLLLGALLTSTAVGHYEVVWQLTIPAVFLAHTAGSGLMAKVSARNTAGIDVLDDIRNTISFTSLFAIPIFFGGVAIARELIIVFYGSAYAPAAPLLIGLAAYRVVRSQSNPLIQAVLGLDHPDVVLKISVVSLLVNAVLGVVLVVSIGAIGVVAATVLTECIRYGGISLFLKSEFEGSFLLSQPFLEQIGAGSAMFLVILSVKQAIPETSWIAIGTLVATGALTYAAVLFVGGPRNREVLLGLISSSS